MKYPLWQVPAEWRCAVWDFWSYWSGFLDNQIALAARLRHWIGDGLTLADARSIFAEMTTPTASQELKFKGDLFAELSRRAATRIAFRRSLAEQAEREQQRQEAAAGAVTGDEFRRLMTAGVGRPT